MLFGLVLEQHKQHVLNGVGALHSGLKTWLGDVVCVVPGKQLFFQKKIQIKKVYKCCSKTCCLRTRPNNFCGCQQALNVPMAPNNALRTWVSVGKLFVLFQANNFFFQKKKEIKKFLIIVPRHVVSNNINNIPIVP